MLSKLTAAAHMVDACISRNSRASPRLALLSPVPLVSRSGLALKSHSPAEQSPYDTYSLVHVKLTTSVRKTESALLFTLLIHSADLSQII